MTEECAVFGVYAPGEDVARLTYFGLYALQHRGQESAGIAVGDGKTVTAMKNLGLVSQVFEETDLAALPGDVAIGHTRYSTTGQSTQWENAQPHMSSIGRQLIALAHNGNLTNTADLREGLQARHTRLQSTTDSEAIAALIGAITQRTHHIRKAVAETMLQVQGAYAVVLITEMALYAFRDPLGIRPLCLGELSEGRGWVVASETCALDIVGARFVREVEPGECIKISADGVESVLVEPDPGARQRAFCMFEYVYFARPDSVMSDLSLYEARYRMGETLAGEYPVEADAVMGVPDSGTPAAIGYAHASGIPFVEGLAKNRYVGRTFIQPSQLQRQLGIRLKLNPMRFAIEGKRLVVVDDSIVRGNTTRALVQMLREAGAREVHMRISSPPVAWPCFFGIDTDTRDQLIGAHKSVEQIRAHIDADSLGYLSQDGMVAATGLPADNFCLACFDGRYPLDVSDKLAAEAAAHPGAGTAQMDVDVSGVSGAVCQGDVCQGSGVSGVSGGRIT
ncbi:MAG: amidophosphoribosyltransferase [Coriobacteriia bacterium]|nr:amidophosphoribosyltransferase [Coriobacteriia bacterium]